ncbi:MAG: acyl-ACP--UDP-N-acetylglucosamine O-acyltransferase [Calditrichia bacterium]|nr:acyl-ACP--UDP-N-acetylglucosamine O-acyltransferase [Calditrichia bacterium]
MAKIHPTADLYPTAELSDDVEIGAYAIIEDDVRIGSGSVIRPHAIVRRYTKMGSNNYVDSFAVLGAEPQDLKFDADTVSYLEIGNNNTFREGTTISRATGTGEKTVVGNNTLWMANSHAGHNSIIHDNVILVNGTLVAGHCTIGKGTILPANGAVHQFCWVGENVMFQGGAFVSMHIPPFVVCSGINNVVSLNAVGLKRRLDITPKDRQEVREAFKITYRSGYQLKQALEEMNQKKDWGAAAGNFRDFISKILAAEPPFNRGLCSHLSRSDQRRK